MNHCGDLLIEDVKNSPDLYRTIHPRRELTL